MLSLMLIYCIHSILKGRLTPANFAIYPFKMNHLMIGSLTLPLACPRWRERRSEKNVMCHWNRLQNSWARKGSWEQRPWRHRRYTILSHTWINAKLRIFVLFFRSFWYLYGTFLLNVLFHACFMIVLVYSNEKKRNRLVLEIGRYSRCYFFV